MADKTNSEHLPKPFFKVIRKSLYALGTSTCDLREGRETREVSFDVDSDRPIECRATAKLASQENEMFLSSLNGLKLVKTLSLKFCYGGQFSL